MSQIGPRIYWVNQFAVPPDQPGGTRHYEMSRVMRDAGRDVTVVASDLNLSSRTYFRRSSGKDRRHIDESVGGVPFAWLPSGSYERNDWRRALGMLAFSLHVVRYLRRTVRRGDVVVGSTPSLLAAGAARLVAALRRTPFILEVRDLWPESMTEVTGGPGPLTVVLRLIADGLYRTSHHIVVLADGNRAPIVARGGREDGITYIPNGVDIGAFADADEKAPPPGLEWVDRHPTFVYAGAHGPANGLDLVLDAAGVLAHTLPQARVLLLGDGPNKRDLQTRANSQGLENVRFHPPITKAEIPSLLRRCAGGLMVLKDVELFRSGVSPNKLFDYMAADLPVVTNVAGEVAAIVRHAHAGVVVPSSDPSGLANAMEAVANREVPLQPGSEYIRQHHDRAELAHRLLTVVDGVSGAPAVSRRGR